MRNRAEIQRPAVGGGVAVLGLAMLALAGCNPPHPKPKAPLLTISKLDCPDSQGDLTRKSASADGLSCVYATGGGDEVTLRLIGLNGRDARSVLDPIEAQLKTEMPAPVAESANPPKTPDTPGEPDKDKVDINLPGIHIHSSGDGHAKVDAPGVHVDAQDGDGKGHSGDHAVVQVGGGGLGGVTVNADDGGAQIRVAENGSGVRATFILASKTPGPHGFRVAGYEARGPIAGPIAVATILAKSEDHDELHDDVRGLLKHNVGN